MVLNRSDCEKLFATLKLSADCKLVDFTLEPFCKEIRGYLGEHFLLTLTDQNVNKYTFFVKVVESDKAMLKCFEDIPLFEKEEYVYKLFQEVKEKLPGLDSDIIPKLLLCKVTEKSKIMVFENLSNRGYRGSLNLKLTYDETMEGLKTLAKYHTVSIAFEQLMKSQSNSKAISIPEYCNDAKLMHPFFTKDEKCSGYKYFRSAESGIFELAKLITPCPWTSSRALQQQIKDSCNGMLDLLNESNDFCKVLSHGDLWAFNLLFKYDESTDKVIDAKIIDFQLCRYVPPAHDVTMLLFCATDENLRKKYLGQFLDCYYKCFQVELAALGIDIKNIISVNEYQETCKLYMPLAKFIWLSYRQTSEQSYKNAIKMQKNYVYMLDSVIGTGRPALIRHLLETDAPYAKGITKIFKEYLEIFDYKPLTVEEVYMIISKKLSTLCLGDVPDYDLLDYSPQEIKKVCGYLGSYWRISITVNVLSGKMENDIKTFKFFVKMLPKTDALLKFHHETGCGYKEKQFYSDLVQRMTECGLMEIEDILPRCYLATMDCLVFDDLTNQDNYNYEMGNVRSNMSLNQVKTGLESLAKLHACGLLLEEKMGRKLNEMYPEEFKETFYSDLDVSKNLLKAGKLGICKGIEMYYNSNKFSSKSKPSDAEMLKIYAIKYIDHFKNLIKPSLKFRNTICHGDLWASNVFFSNEKCKLLDFQSYRYCPGTHDLTQFLFFAMYRMERKEHWQELVEYYYKKFEQIFKNHGYNVENFMPYEDFLKSVDVEKQFALLQNLTHFQTILLSPEALEKFFSEPELASKYCFVDRSEHVRMHWENDEIYRKRMTDAIEDFIEFYRKLC